MEQVLAQLQQLARLAQDAGLQTVARELTDERIPALRNGRLSLVVLGEFNHGKSSLINALLGAPVLPTGVTPTTSVITRLVHGNQPGVCVHTMDDRTERAQLPQLNELIVRENNNIRHVEVTYPSPLLADRVELVDTPGVNDISQQKVEVTYGIVPRADLVLFLLDATQVLKHSELRFIEQRMLGGLGDRLIFVISKIDRLEPDEAEEVIRYARERLEASLGPGVLIFPISARRASRPEGDPGFALLRTHLLDFLHRQRDQILLDSALGTGLRSGNTLLGNLRIKLRGYQMSRQELSERVATVRQKLRDSQRVIAQNVTQINESCAHLRDSARQRLAAFRDDFLAALPREIEKADPNDVQRYLPGFIEDCFRTFLDAEGKSTARTLEALAEEIIAVTNDNLRDTLGALLQELGLDPKSLSVDVDSTAYDVSVFAMGAFGVSVLLFNLVLGSLISLATPVVALILKDKLEARIKQQATDAGLASIRSAAARADTQVAHVIDDFGLRLRQFIEDAGDRLYRQIDEALRAVISERDAASPSADPHALESHTQAIEAQARDLVAQLQSRRQSLWQGKRP
jgi:GTP-binding protein EngB required for normal cell division